MNPQVADFSTYTANKKKECIEPQDFGLPRNDLRHLKVLDFLDKNSVKTVKSWKNELGLVNPKIPEPLQTCKGKYSTLKQEIQVRSITEL